MSVDGGREAEAGVLGSSLCCVCKMAWTSWWGFCTPPGARGDKAHVLPPPSEGEGALSLESFVVHVASRELPWKSGTRPRKESVKLEGPRVSVYMCPHEHETGEAVGRVCVGSGHHMASEVRE